MTGFSHTLDVSIPALDKQLIGGAWVDSASSETLPAISPSTEEELTRVVMPTTNDADRAVDAAYSAFQSGPWSRISVEERIEVCARLCDALERRLPELNRAWTFESGPTIAHGEIINDMVGVMVWRQMLDFARDIEWEEDRDGAKVMREPVGPVLTIMTFNGPIVLMGMKVIPALLAGNTVIAKFAPESQLTMRLIGEAVIEAGFPAGVVSLLAADTPVTQHLVSHDKIDLVSLTGGTSIGIDVVKRTADRLARTIMELGGKSPAILLDDVDLDQAMETLVGGSTGFMGQVCVNLSRILAPKSRYDEIVDALAERYKAIRLGDPLSGEVDQGPMSVERGRDRAEAYVAGALREGAEIAAGGKRPQGFQCGYWYEPTLLRAVDNQMKVAREEVFGPVTIVIPYEGDAEALAIANDSDFGLAASIYSPDQERAWKMARQLQSGTVAINMAGISFAAPFGGYKKSGWGKECGPEGILAFTQVKQVVAA